MTRKIYTTAQGKSIDLGTIALKNEHVRAVGNMNVNARGDVLDHANNVIETKPQLIQRQNSRLTNVSADPVQTSQRSAKKSQTKSGSAKPNTAQAPVVPPAPTPASTPAPTPAVESIAPVIETPPVEQIAPLMAPPQQEIVAPEVPGLAGAIARSKQVKQELDKTRRQLQQAQGVRKF